MPITLASSSFKCFLIYIKKKKEKKKYATVFHTHTLQQTTACKALNFIGFVGFVFVVGFFLAVSLVAGKCTSPFSEGLIFLWRSCFNYRNYYQMLILKEHGEKASTYTSNDRAVTRSVCHEHSRVQQGRERERISQFVPDWFLPSGNSWHGPGKERGRRQGRCRRIPRPCRERSPRRSPVAST